jgi:DNA-binding NarL/FixJ family response regulator
MLLMNDEELFCKMAAAMLRCLGCQIVETVACGDEAVEKYRQAMEGGEPFDLVILDLVVRRGRGGREVIKDLIRIDPAVRAVVISGYSDDPVMVDCYTYGFVGALVKPFRMTELEKMIQSLAAMESKGKESTHVAEV